MNTARKIFLVYNADINFTLQNLNEKTIFQITKKNTKKICYITKRRKIATEKRMQRHYPALQIQNRKNVKESFNFRNTHHHNYPQCLTLQI